MRRKKDDSCNYVLSIESSNTAIGVGDDHLYEVLINCYQTKFVAIILVLSVFFLMPIFAWPIFCLTLLTFRPQKRDKQVAPIKCS